MDLVYFLQESHLHVYLCVVAKLNKSDTENFVSMRQSWTSKIPCSLFAPFGPLNNLNHDKFQFTGAFLIKVSQSEADSESYGSEKN